MVDIIGEIISYEKQAEEIVRSAEKTSKEMVEVAQKVKESIRLKYIEERDNRVKGYHEELKAIGTQHINDTIDARDEKIRQIDAYFDENGDKLVEDIFSAVVNNV